MLLLNFAFNRNVSNVGADILYRKAAKLSHRTVKRLLRCARNDSECLDLAERSFKGECLNVIAKDLKDDAAIRYRSTRKNIPTSLRGRQAAAISNRTDRSNSNV